ncbi:MAG: zinc-dependent metalloprotease [Armatimonadetes bacterium]|nr:zinc-dependent metalloprotease [Armatimonadota bacterium]MDW8122547.1 zinc-dependent metalloprotease [Armatimonadota bacterium]
MRLLTTPAILLIVSFSFALGSLFCQQPSDPPQGKPVSEQKKEEPPKEEKKPPDKFAEIIKDAQKEEGLFTVYRKENRFYLELTSDQLDKPYILAITLEKGVGEGGLYSAMTLDDFVFTFRRNGDRLTVIRKNLQFRVLKDHPWKKVVERSFSDSVVAATKIEVDRADKKAFLIDLSGLLLADIQGMGQWINSALGGSYRMVRDDSYIVLVKAFPNNVEAEAEYTFVSERGGNAQTLPDPRSLTVRLHFSFSELPKDDYQPRLADLRVGYFVVAFKEFSDDSRRSPFIRYICRWNLKKRDPQAPLSLPVKPIVFWIENTTPKEYRQAIREGILMWNKAFEQAGFSQALVAKEMPDDADWHPADMRYNVIRWMVSHDDSFAVGPSRVNPFTGQILDADIVIEANFLRFVKREWRLLVNPAAARMTLFPDPITVLDQPNWQPPQTTDDRAEFSLRRAQACDYGYGLAQRAAYGALVLSLLSGEPLRPEPPAEYVNAFLRQLVAHEVGHTLGLRHNFAGSSLLSPEALHQKEVTERIGLSNSVMDYLTVNLAPPGKKQGEYWSSTVGPYDCWAIEYGYRTVPDAQSPEDELPALQKIASRAPRPELAYGTDEDTWGVGFDLDPHIVRWDFSRDPMTWAVGELELVRSLWPKLEKNFPTAGEGYWELRDAFNLLLGEWRYKTFVIARYIGGQYTSRDMPNDPGSRPPFVPVNPALQRKALSLLDRYLFSEEAFHFPPSLLNKLTIEKWWHWGSSPTNLERPDYPIHLQILNLQRSLLNRLFHPLVLARIQDAERKVEEPFTLSEHLETMTKIIWKEVLQSRSKSLNGFRRNLQKAHLQILTSLLLQPSPQAPIEAGTLARRELKRLQEAVRRSAKVVTDPATQAHLDDVLTRITKVLEASVQITGGTL